MLLFRTLSHVAANAVSPGHAIQIDAQAAAARLAQALPFRTISYQDRSRQSRRFIWVCISTLPRSFPEAHRTLQRELMNEYSLLYTWTGTEPTLPPVLLLGHLDVVPVEPGTEKEWTYPPFAGTVADGYIWGRGAMDDKVAVLGALEAVEHLFRQRFAPAPDGDAGIRP